MEGRLYFDRPADDSGDNDNLLLREEGNENVSSSSDEDKRNDSDDDKLQSLSPTHFFSPPAPRFTLTVPTILPKIIKIKDRAKVKALGEMTAEFVEQYYQLLQDYLGQLHNRYYFWDSWKKIPARVKDFLMLCQEGLIGLTQIEFELQQAYNAWYFWAQQINIEIDRGIVDLNSDLASLMRVLSAAKPIVQFSSIVYKEKWLAGPLNLEEERSDQSYAASFLLREQYKISQVEKDIVDDLVYSGVTQSHVMLQNLANMITNPQLLLAERESSFKGELSLIITKYDENGNKLDKACIADLMILTYNYTQSFIRAFFKKFINSAPTLEQKNFRQQFLRDWERYQREQKQEDDKTSEDNLITLQQLRETLRGYKSTSSRLQCWFGGPIRSNTVKALRAKAGFAIGLTTVSQQTNINEMSSKNKNIPLLYKDAQGNYFIFHQNNTIKISGPDLIAELKKMTFPPTGSLVKYCHLDLPQKIEDIIEEKKSFMPMVTKQDIFNAINTETWWWERARRQSLFKSPISINHEKNTTCTDAMMDELADKFHQISDKALKIPTSF